MEDTQNDQEHQGRSGTARQQAGRGTLGKDGGRKRRDEVEVASSPLLIRERESRMRWS